MIEKIIIFMTDSMYDSGIIDDKTKNIYKYCLEQLISQILFAITFIAFGIIYREPIVSIIYLISTMTLRTFGGGAHASSKNFVFICLTG